MKTPKIVLTALMLMLCASVAYGQVLMPQAEPGPVPPAPYQAGGIPVYGAGSYPAPMVSTAPLFTRVKYKDLHEKAPCARMKFVQVLNPCYDGCCGPRCVTVQICVPECGCEDVRVRSHGKRVRYDYGKYAVDVRVKRGYIEVDYQD
jgi:hypothetical protein